MSVAGALLAAGASTRLGRPKQLVAVGRGMPLVLHALLALRVSRCEPTAVVLGAHRDAIEPLLAASAGTSVLVNEAWSSGMASSIHVAVRWAQATACEGLLLTVCDQPFLTAKHLDALVAAFERDRRTVGSSYGDVVGAPAIFERARFAELLALEGDRGARALLRDAASVAWPEGATDIDTAEDLDVLATKKGS